MTLTNRSGSTEIIVPMPNATYTIIINRRDGSAASVCSEASYMRAKSSSILWWKYCVFQSNKELYVLDLVVRRVYIQISYLNLHSTNSTHSMQRYMHVSYQECAFVALCTLNRDNNSSAILRDSSTVALPMIIYRELFNAQQFVVRTLHTQCTQYCLVGVLCIFVHAKRNSSNQISSYISN